MRTNTKIKIIKRAERKPFKEETPIPAEGSTTYKHSQKVSPTHTGRTVTGWINDFHERKEREAAAVRNLLRAIIKAA
jgi:hypothetical protein